MLGQCRNATAAAIWRPGKRLQISGYCPTVALTGSRTPCRYIRSARCGYNKAKGIRTYNASSNVAAVRLSHRTFSSHVLPNKPRHAADPELYEREFRRSLDNPEEFWAEAAEQLHWNKKWDKVLDDSNSPFTKW